MKINNIDEIRAFIFLYQEKSYTKAAAKLKISKAALSNKISNLEENIKSILFHRSTRTVSATQEADSFYRNAIKLLEAVTDLEQSFVETKNMAGKIHVTCSNSIVSSFLGKRIVEFIKIYPDLNIELTVTDSYLDLLENNIDLAIRIGQLPSSSLYGKKIGTNKIIFACSPDYLNKHKVPKNLKELENHNLAYLDIHEKLQFRHSNLKLAHFAKNRKIVSNYSIVINQYGLEGGGIIVRSYWDLKDYIQTNKLIEINLDDSLEDYGHVWLLTTRNRLENIRIKTLFHFIAEQWNK